VSSYDVTGISSLQHLTGGYFRVKVFFHYGGPEERLYSSLVIILVALLKDVYVVVVHDVVVIRDFIKVVRGCREYFMK